LRLLALFFTIIFVSAFFVRLIQTDYVTVKVEQVTIDSRGAELNAELYYPAGTSTKDSLPAVLVNHGGGANLGLTTGIAVELARRGFVVLNTSAYGAGLSTMPKYDAFGKGESPSTDPGFPMDDVGVYDALQFVKSLEFVDSTRIGMIGHSAGAGRVGNTAVLDCGYYSFNDIMINVLYDTFGQKFTEDEINLDADTLAAERLNDDQLVYYHALREENWTEYDSKAKSAIVMGLGLFAIYNNPSIVTVGGYEVERGIQANLAFVYGSIDADGTTASTTEMNQAAWYRNSDLLSGSWYDVNTVSKTSDIVGTLFENSVVSDEALANSIDNRTSRMFYTTNIKMTHSKELFSNEINTTIVKYFEQTLGYNRGNLTDSDTAPLDASNNTWYWQSIFTLIAMISMIGLLVAAAGILLTSGAFKSCVCTVSEKETPKLSKKQYRLFNTAVIVISFISIYIACKVSENLVMRADLINKFWPAAIPWGTFTFLGCLSIGTVILLSIMANLSKKKNGYTGLKPLNVGINIKEILRSLGLAFILLVIAYSSLSIIEYFFGQDYRFWLSIFTQMKADNWVYAFNYGIVAFPCFVILGMGMNYVIRTDIPEWKETLNTVIVNFASVLVCCLINYIVACINYDKTLSYFASFTLTYSFLILIPLTIYINRKMYILTKRVWVGALLNTMLVAWSIASTVGTNDFYTAQTWLSNFLNF
jgi:hypothetical protein